MTDSSSLINLSQESTTNISACTISQVIPANYMLLLCLNVYYIYKMKKKTNVGASVCILGVS